MHASGVSCARAARLAVPLALLVAAINPLVSREGLTLLAQGPAVPLYGQLDVTLEAVVYGAVAALRVLVVVLAFARLLGGRGPGRHAARAASRGPALGSHRVARDAHGAVAGA